MTAAPPPEVNVARRSAYRQTRISPEPWKFPGPQHVHIRTAPAQSLVRRRKIASRSRTGRGGPGGRWIQRGSSAPWPTEHQAHLGCQGAPSMQQISRSQSAPGGGWTWRFRSAPSRLRDRPAGLNPALATARDDRCLVMQRQADPCRSPLKPD